MLLGDIGTNTEKPLNQDACGKEGRSSNFAFAPKHYILNSKNLRGVKLELSACFLGKGGINSPEMFGVKKLRVIIFGVQLLQDELPISSQNWLTPGASQASQHSSFCTIHCLKSADPGVGGAQKRGTGICQCPTKHSWENILGNLSVRAMGFLFLRPLCIDDSSLSSSAPHWNTHVHKKSMIVRLTFENLRNNNFGKTRMSGNKNSQSGRCL